MAKYKYLAPPEGYYIAEAIRSDNTERLRALALEMIDPNDPKLDEFNKIMAKATLQELHDFFKSNGYRFLSKSSLKKGGLWEAMQTTTGSNN